MSNRRPFNNALQTDKVNLSRLLRSQKATRARIPDLFTGSSAGAFLLLGAVAGAFAGAVAAQRVSDRAKERDAVRAEIRSVNAAIMVAHTTCNAGLALKNQFVKEIYDDYHETNARLQEFIEHRARREIPQGDPLHSARLKERYDKIARIRQAINRMDLSDARKDGLMPDPENYQDWLRGFAKTAPELEKRRGLLHGLQLR